MDSYISQNPLRVLQVFLVGDVIFPGKYTPITFRQKTHLEHALWGEISGNGLCDKYAGDNGYQICKCVLMKILQNTALTFLNEYVFSVCKCKVFIMLLPLKQSFDLSGYRPQLIEKGLYQVLLISIAIYSNKKFKNTSESYLWFPPYTFHLLYYTQSQSLVQAYG